MSDLSKNPSIPVVAKAILDRITTKAHSVWATSDFKDLAGQDILDIALFNLKSAGHLQRAAKGLYYKPWINTLTGRPTVADPQGVVDAIARRSGARYIVDGMTAANDLAWETAVPAHYIVYTDARLQPVKLGNLEIQFKTVSSGRLIWAGNPGMRVVQALYYFQDKLARDQEILDGRLRQLLSNPDHGAAIAEGLKQGYQQLPDWMQSFLRPHLFLAVENDIDAEEEPSSGVRP